MAENALVCPSCARSHLPSERFCEACGMPLVQPGGREPSTSARQQRARKIKPQYAEGELVKVARAANQPEAEFIAGLLLEEGIPSMLRRSAGFDVAESLAAGPRDVLVPESGAEAAREALAWEGRSGDAG
jgi:Putative prokaryotic signal transducing protein